MKPLELKSIGAVDHLVRPEEFSDITWESSALKVFTDFRYHVPLVIDHSIPVLQAAFRMRKAHVNLMLVIGSDDDFEGTISASDLSEQEIIQHTAKGRLREDLTVADLMQPRDELQALEYSSLVNASIRDVVETLKQKGHKHCLVLDSEQHHIRGLISSSDIARRMHVPIEISHQSTFVDLFNTIRH